MRRLWRDQRGSAEAVELAFTLPILLMVVFGIIGFCQAMYAYHFVSFAAQEGARYAMVRGADWTTACATSAPPSFTLTYQCNAAASDVQNFVRSAATLGIKATNITVTTTWPGTTPSAVTTCPGATTNSKGCFVKVQVSYPFYYPVPFLPTSAVTFTGTSEKVIQQ
jgi:Flp pilus assembly protein TadG